VYKGSKVTYFSDFAAVHGKDREREGHSDPKYQSGNVEVGDVGRTGDQHPSDQERYHGGEQRSLATPPAKASM